VTLDCPPLTKQMSESKIVVGIINELTGVQEKLAKYERQDYATRWGTFTNEDELYRNHILRLVLEKADHNEILKEMYRLRRTKRSIKSKAHEMFTFDASRIASKKKIKFTRAELEEALK